MMDPEEVPVGSIFAVHIVDANRMDIPVLDISRKHRVFRGKGEIPIPEILSALKAKNYCGSLALEIFNEE